MCGRFVGNEGMRERGRRWARWLQTTMPTKGCLEPSQPNLDNSIILGADLHPLCGGLTGLSHRRPQLVRPQPLVVAFELGADLVIAKLECPHIGLLSGR